VVYQLELPASWKILNTFHASLLSPYQETEEHGPNFTNPLPDLIEGKEEYEVEQILASRRHGRGHKLQYLVKWVGYAESHNSWELVENVNVPELVKEFHHQNPVAVREIVFNTSGNPEQPPMSPQHSHLTPTSSCLLSPYSQIAAGSEGISEVQDGMAVSMCLWYDNSSPYTSQET